MDIDAEALRAANGNWRRNGRGLAAMTSRPCALSMEIDAGPCALSMEIDAEALCDVNGD